MGRGSIREQADRVGLGVSIHSPGDGSARFEFYRLEKGPGNTFMKAKGIREAGLLLDGYETGINHTLLMMTGGGMTPETPE